MDELDVIFERKNIYDRQSWYNESAPIFNNLEVLDEERGYKKPLINYDLYTKECYANCDQLDIRVRQNCYWFCDFRKMLELGSVDYARKACPLRDKRCCKAVAKDNDFAYLNCIGAKDLYPLVPDSFRKKMIIFIILSVSIFFVFLGLVFLILM
jgi:hypothetical protein